MKRIVTAASFAALLGIVATAPVRTAEPRAVGEFMRAKLKHSQKILEGLALENFQEIAAGAHEISQLSQAATWQVIDTEDYVQRSTDFRRAAEALEFAAKKRNLDGAALAYVDMTMKCVNCHKYVRGIRMATLESDPLGARYARTMHDVLEPMQ